MKRGAELSTWPRSSLVPCRRDCRWDSPRYGTLQDEYCSRYLGMRGMVECFIIMMFGEIGEVVFHKSPLNTIVMLC